MIVREMTYDQCLQLLSEQHVARLACVRGGQPYIVPIQYVLSGKRIYSFSMPGQKIEWMRANPRACLEIDLVEGACNWKSVVVHGLFHELADTERGHGEHLHAWSLIEKRCNWWEPGAFKPSGQTGASTLPVFYCIDIQDVTGRMAMDAEG